MSTDQTSVPQTFSVLRVVKSTLVFAFKHALVLFPAALILIPLPQILAGMVMANTPPERLVFSPYYWVALVGSMITGYLLQSLVVRVVLRDKGEAKLGLGAAFGASLQRILTVFFLLILMFLGVTLGTALLIVPGLILGTMWCVAIPALIVEGIGPFKALGRSQALTKGHRWPIFGMFVLAGVLSFVVTFAGYRFDFAAMASSTQVMDMPQILLNAAIAALTAVIFSCGLAAIYAELRLIKDGTTRDAGASVAAVFS